jgi:hypothetical protein
MAHNSRPVGKRTERKTDSTVTRRQQDVAEGRMELDDWFDEHVIIIEVQT